MYNITKAKGSSLGNENVWDKRDSVALGVTEILDQSSLTSDVLFEKKLALSKKHDGKYQ